MVVQPCLMQHAHVTALHHWAALHHSSSHHIPLHSPFLSDSSGLSSRMSSCASHGSGSSPGRATCTSWQLASTGLRKPAIWPLLVEGHTRVVLENILAAAVYPMLTKLRQQQQRGREEGVVKDRNSRGHGEGVLSI